VKPTNVLSGTDRSGTRRFREIPLGTARLGRLAVLYQASAKKEIAMFRSRFALFALAVLSLALCSPTAKADPNLVYHPDGTSTMTTNYGPNDPLNHTTEFDAQGNVTKITWLGPPTTIVEYDALGRVNSVTVAEDNPDGGKTIRIRTNIYFPGGVIRYWVRVRQVDRDGSTILVNDEHYWGGLSGQMGNGGNCAPQFPVAPGKTYSKDKDAKCQTGFNKPETGSNPAGVGREFRSVPAHTRLAPARPALAPVAAPRSIQYSLPRVNSSVKPADLRPR
jgi:hypothetical protein